MYLKYFKKLNTLKIFLKNFKLIEKENKNKNIPKTNITKLIRKIKI